MAAVVTEDALYMQCAVKSPLTQVIAPPDAWAPLSSVVLAIALCTVDAPSLTRALTPVVALLPTIGALNGLRTLLRVMVIHDTTIRADHMWAVALKVATLRAVIALRLCIEARV